MIYYQLCFLFPMDRYVTPLESFLIIFGFVYRNVTPMESFLSITSIIYDSYGVFMNFENCDYSDSSIVNC